MRVHERRKMNGAEYDAEYFLRGKESGKSLYEDYRWMPGLTIPMAQAIVTHCRMPKGTKVLDFGCARGYLVKALHEIGYNGFGIDVSQWAIDNCDPEASGLVSLHSRTDPYPSAEWIIAKDVLEHVPSVRFVINDLMMMAEKGLFVVVPLSRFDNGRYVIEEYEKDVTHIHRLTLATWVGMFLQPGWRVEAAYRLPGVKDNYARPGWEYGNGFVTARRVE